MKDWFETWDKLLAQVKRVDEVLRNVAGVFFSCRPVWDLVNGLYVQLHPIAKIAFGVQSIIEIVSCLFITIIASAHICNVEQPIVQQMERDMEMKILLDDLVGTLDLMERAKDLEARCQDPHQVKIITDMLWQTTECGYFIQAYAKDSGFCASLFLLSYGSFEPLFSSGSGGEQLWQ